MRRLKQRIALVEMGFGVAGLDGDRSVEVGNRAFVLPEVVERRAAIVPALRNVGIDSL